MSHPRLRPGLHVVRRDDRHLQVGVDPPWRLVLPDEPDVLRLLDDLRRRPAAAARTTPAAHRALIALAAAGLLVDPRRRTGATAEVAVVGAGATAAEATRILRAAGLRRRCPVDRAEVALVLADGEPRRDATSTPTCATAGRTWWSRPRRTASRSGRSWCPAPPPACAASTPTSASTTRGARWCSSRSAACRPSRDDPALTALVAGWAVRDLLSYVEGGQPSTWSATVEIGPDLAPRHRSWAAAPALRLLVGRRAGRLSGHQNSLSSLPSIARRLAREHSSQ